MRTCLAGSIPKITIQPTFVEHHHHYYISVRVEQATGLDQDLLMVTIGATLGGALGGTRGAAAGAAIGLLLSKVVMKPPRLS